MLGVEEEFLGGISCFTEGIEPDVRSELLDLLSFASLAASHDHDISNDIKGWYEKYFHI